MREELDRWFPPVLSKEHDDYNYIVRQAVGHPMVLFSTVNPNEPVPLAGLTLVSKEGGALIWQRPESCAHQADAANFQGLVNKDGSEFKLVLSNLNNLGMINFNVMKQADPVMEVDPGGLNQINELRPMEAYSCECDQSNNFALVLKSIGGGMTVKEGEREAKGDASKAHGLYYWLSVVPENSSAELKALFAKTEWRTPDCIITRENILRHKGPSFSTNGLRLPWLSTGLDGSEEEDMDGGLFDDEEPDDEALDDFPRGTMRALVAASASTNDAPRMESYNSEGVEQRVSELGLRPHILTCDQSGMFSDARSDSNLRMRKKIKSNASVTDSSLRDRREVIDASLAAKAVHSDRKVLVNSYETGKEYAYELASPLCVLNLSIDTRLEIMKNHVSEREMSSMLDEVIAGTFQRMLGEISTIYVETTCVICMDDDPGPSTVVFYKCGHKCAHTECATSLTACPLCRAPIVGRIDTTKEI